MRKLILSLVVLLALAGVASAATITEGVGGVPANVGETLATAYNVPGGTDLITGIIGSDADLYRFYWGGGAFYATSVGSAAGNDTQLFLFDSAGLGVAANDDGTFIAGPAFLSLGALGAGFYHLGISEYDHDPYSAAGLMFQSYPWAPQYGPLSPGGLSPLSSWSGGNSGGGAYEIHFQAVTGSGVLTGDPTPTGDPPPENPIPEPATLLLVGSGLATMASRLRKR